MAIYLLQQMSQLAQIVQSQSVVLGWHQMLNQPTSRHLSQVTLDLRKM